MVGMSEQDSPIEDRPEPVSVPAPGPSVDTEPEVEHSFVADGVDYMLDPNWVLASRLSGGIFAVMPRRARRRPGSSTSDR